MEHPVKRMGTCQECTHLNQAMLDEGKGIECHKGSTWLEDTCDDFISKGKQND